MTAADAGLVILGTADVAILDAVLLLGAAAVATLTAGPAAAELVLLTVGFELALVLAPEAEPVDEAMLLGTTATVPAAFGTALLARESS